jgi:hypothetical protein
MCSQGSFEVVAVRGAVSVVPRRITTFVLHPCRAADHSCRFTRGVGLVTFSTINRVGTVRLSFTCRLPALEPSADVGPVATPATHRRTVPGSTARAAVTEPSVEVQQTLLLVLPGEFTSRSPDAPA